MRRVLLLLGAVVVLGAAALAWRLARGPLDVSFLAPSLERALTPADGTLAVRIGGVDLAWDTSERDLDLRARDVRVHGAGGESLAAFPLLAVKLRGAPLLRGALEPHTVELFGARLRLVRLPEGGIHLGVGDAGVDGRALASGLGGGMPAGAGSGLRRVEVRDGDVLLADQATGTTWHATGVQLALERVTAGGLTLTLSGTVAVDGGAVPFHAEGTYDPGAARGAGTVSVEDLHPAALAAVVPGEAGAVLRRVAVPLRGTVALELGERLRVRTARFDVAGGPGSLATPELPAAKLPVERVRLAAVLDVDAATATVGELALDLGRTGVRAHGRLEDARRFHGEVIVSDLPADRLDRWWPVTAAPAVRGWVTARVRRGRIHRATVRVAEQIEASLAFDGLEVRYDDALPPLRDAAGTASLDARGWRFRVARGAVGGLELVHATVDVPPSGRQAQVEASTRGPLAAGLEVARASVGAQAVDAVPLASGDLTADLHLGIPLGGGRLDLAIDARADAATVAASLRQWVHGPVGVRARVTRDAVDVSADLVRANLDLPLLAVAKPAGRPADVAARLLLAGNALRAVERFSFVAAGTTLTGRATRARDGSSWQDVEAAATIAPRDHDRDGGHLALTLRRAGAQHRFVVTSDDAGALFRVFEAGSEATGGALRYAGTADLAAPGVPLDGRLELRAFTVQRAPLLARIAAAASLSGITGALAGRGIAFESLTGGIASRGTTLTLTDLVATGSSMSVVVNGTIDRVARTAALRGTVVPSYYGLNTAPGRIPVIGKLATGGEGLQAIDFTATGPLGEPRVTVNALSALAPGLLRDVLRRVPRGSR